MKWETFLQIALLILLVAILTYLIYPKYDFHAPKENEIVRANVITGRIVNLRIEQ
ncbi:MAG: hypothetical protein JXD21_05860 [Candidatus Omnitrophica bacterium]|nr:hypothetical protein [Candidatus Omnitrophota bacterium]